MEDDVTRRSKLTRRRFLSLIAAGSAAAATAPMRSIAAPATERKKPAPPAPSPAVAREIEKQKGYVADALKTIRAHQLPAGSDMAFVFQPLRPRRKEARRAR